MKTPSSSPQQKPHTIPAAREASQGTQRSNDGVRVGVGVSSHIHTFPVRLLQIVEPLDSEYIDHSIAAYRVRGFRLWFPRAHDNG